MKSRLFITTAWLLFAASLFSQGAISGTVIDPETEEPLIFATVVLTQNGIVLTGAMTDFDGKFVITDLADGIYKLECRYVGFDEYVLEDVKVKSGETTPVEIRMTTYYIPCCCYTPMAHNPPLIEIDNTTSGHTFTSRDIRRLGKEQ